MGILEEEARFLTAKYGTAAGPTGLPQESLNAITSAPGLDIATLMVLLGFLVFFALLFVIVRDVLAMREVRRNPRYLS